MKVGLVQTNPQDNVDQNLREAREGVQRAAAEGAQVVVLPEMFSFMGDDQFRSQYADRLSEGVFSQLSEWAKEFSVTLVGGSHGEKPGELKAASAAERIFNTSQCFSAEGKVLNTYRKLHLFNLRSRSGQTEFRESDVYLMGEPPQVCFELPVEKELWKAMTLICYDLRFPEIIRRSSQGDDVPDVLFFPSAFTQRTGQAHWEPLLRARAIENQCFVVACNQTGRFSGGKKSNYGHSMVVSPWGEVLLDLGPEVSVGVCQLEKRAIDEARAQIPALSNRVL